MAVRRNGIKGTGTVLRNLNREIAALKNRGVAGLQKAALIVQRRSMQLTPVDTGNLKGSCYTRVNRSLVREPMAEIGYTASYAIYVHEIPNKHKSPTQWKFLETALKEKQKQIFDAIRNDARIRSMGRHR